MVALAVVVLGLVGWVLAWYEGQVAGSPGGAQVVLTVADGAPVGTVVGDLAHRHVLSSTLAFRVYLVLHGTPVVRPGGYLLYEHEPFADVRRALARGPDVFPVRVRAGNTLSEIAREVDGIPGHSGAAFLAAARSGQVHSPWLGPGQLQVPGSVQLDGLLAPGTYLVLPGETDVQLLQQMADAMTTLAHTAGLPQAAAPLGITPYQAFIVASIVQKEGVYPKNMAKVARVVYNRLARGMPLQMDSTVLYAEDRDGGPVTAADLALDTPYNTYLHAGLTPTPICFPSAAALQAALHPAVGNWLYFELVSPDGTEAFEDTYAQHQADVQRARQEGLP